MFNPLAFGSIALIAAFGYEQVTMHRPEKDSWLTHYEIPSFIARAFISHLAKLAGWDYPDNKIAFLFQKDEHEMCLITSYDSSVRMITWQIRDNAKLPDHVASHVNHSDRVQAAIDAYKGTVVQGTDWDRVNGKLSRIRENGKLIERRAS